MERSNHYRKSCYSSFKRTKKNARNVTFSLTKTLSGVNNCLLAPRVSMHHFFWLYEWSATFHELNRYVSFSLYFFITSVFSLLTKKLHVFVVGGSPRLKPRATAASAARAARIATNRNLTQVPSQRQSPTRASTSPATSKVRSLISNLYISIYEFTTK